MGAKEKGYLNCVVGSKLPKVLLQVMIPLQKQILGLPLVILQTWHTCQIHRLPAPHIPHPRQAHSKSCAAFLEGER